MTTWPSTTNAHVYEHSDEMKRQLFSTYKIYKKYTKLKKDLTGTYKIDK